VVTVASRTHPAEEVAELGAMIGFDAPMVSVSLLLANGGGGGEGSREGNVALSAGSPGNDPSTSLLPKGAPAPSLVETGVMVLPVRLRDPVKPARRNQPVTTGPSRGGGGGGGGGAGIIKIPATATLTADISPAPTT